MSSTSPPPAPPADAEPEDELEGFFSSNTDPAVAVLREEAKARDDGETKNSGGEAADAGEEEEEEEEPVSSAQPNSLALRTPRTGQISPLPLDCALTWWCGVVV